MGIWQNLVNRFRHAKNEADKATTDYVVNAEVSLEDGKRQLTAIERQLHELRSNAKINEGRRDETQATFNKIKDLIQRQAKAAEGKTGDELEKAKSNLRELIKERGESELALADCQTVVVQDELAIKQVTSSRDEIKAQLRRAESKIAAEKAQLMVAQTTQSIRNDVTTYNKQGVLADVNALEEKVHLEQAKADVAVEMSGEGSEKRLAAIEASLKSGPSADEEIESLLGNKPAETKSV